MCSLCCVVCSLCCVVLCCFDPLCCAVFCVVARYMSGSFVAILLLASIINEEVLMFVQYKDHNSKEH